MQKGWRVSVFSFSSAIATERSQSVSVTHRAYANLDDIPKTAGWSSECCFAKY